VAGIWQGAFYQSDRLYTSQPFAKTLGFKQHLLPFSLLLNKGGSSMCVALEFTAAASAAVSMSHVDATREVLDLGFENAVYMRPVVAPVLGNGGAHGSCSLSI
jgi:hypothetical protein